MLTLVVRTARHQVCQAFGVRAQGVKFALPSAASVPALIQGNRWRGDKRLVFFPFSEKNNQPFVMNDSLFRRYLYGFIK